MTDYQCSSNASDRRWRTDTELVQSDIAMNLFMVLMVVLATLALSTAVVAVIGFKIKLSSEPLPTEERPLGLARSWAPVLPISPRLVLRDGAVQRLDLDQFATMFATRRSYLPILNNSSHLTEDPDPAAYRIEFTLNTDPIPDGIVAWRTPLASFARDNWTRLPRAFQDDIETFEQFDLFVYPGHEETAWDIAALLYNKRKRYRLLFIRNQKKLHFERSSSRFTFEDMYK